VSVMRIIVAGRIFRDFAGNVRRGNPRGIYFTIIIVPVYYTIILCLSFMTARSPTWTFKRSFIRRQELCNTCQRCK